MGLKVTGLDEAIDETGGMAERMRRLAPVLDEAAKELKTFIEQRFDQRTAPDGKGWLPVTLHTATYRETDGEGLRNSRFASVRFDSVSYGAKASFADVHQHGDGRVPARPYAPVETDGGPAAELVEKIKDRIDGYVREGTR